MKIPLFCLNETEEKDEYKYFIHLNVVSVHKRIKISIYIKPVI